MSYRLGLERVGPPSPSARVIQFGQQLLGELNPNGDLELFSFVATAGQTINVQAVALAPGSPCIQTYRPDGTRLGGACFNAGSNSVTVSITQTGVHTILVAEYAVDQIITFNITLQCLASCPPPPPPPAPTIAITAPTSELTYAAPGASITLEGLTTGAVTSITWSSDRGFSGSASGLAAWFANDIPLLTGSNVLIVQANGPGGSSTDTITVTVTTLSYFLAEGATGAFFDSIWRSPTPTRRPHRSPSPS